MKEHYKNKMMTSGHSIPCRECGGSGEVEERQKTAKGLVVRRHRCPVCGGQRPGYRTK